MMEAPRWAASLVKRVVEDYCCCVPFLEWSEARRRTYSDGRCYIDKPVIAIHAGRDVRDQRLTLLHELAHWVMLPDPCYQGDHGPQFWELAWKFYRRYRVPIRWALTSEGRYTCGRWNQPALVAYRRTGGRL